MDFDIERIKSAIPLETYIQGLKKEGRLYTMCCPFHSEKHASFKIDPEKQTWYCYGTCEEGGDIFSYVMKRENMTFPEAKEELARVAGIELTPMTPERKAQESKRERIYKLMDAAAQYFHEDLFNAESQYSPVWAYATSKRGLSQQTIVGARVGYALNEWQALYNHFYLDYSEDELLTSGLCKRSEKTNQLYDTFRDRLMIPVRDMKGRVVAFTGRALQKETDPKYLHNITIEGVFEKSKILHRMPEFDARRGIESVVCVEGSIDPSSAANRGIYNIVSLLGKSLSETQLSLLAKIAPRLIFCYDNDTPGKAATLKLGEHLPAAARLGVELFVMTAPYGKDPDDTFRVHPELWNAAVEAARPLVDALIEAKVQALPLSSTAHQKTAPIKELLNLIDNTNPLIAREAREKIANAFAVQLEDLEAMSASKPTLKIVVRNTSVKPAQMPQAYPPMELTVLNGILINDHQRWIDRANAALMIVGPYPKALSPLSFNDFTHLQTRSLMTMVARAIEARQRPLHQCIEADIGDGPLNEVYWRAAKNPDVQAMYASERPQTAFVLDYEDFLHAVKRLRRNRLERELAQGVVLQTDILEWAQARRMLAETHA